MPLKRMNTNQTRVRTGTRACAKTSRKFRSVSFTAMRHVSRYINWARLIPDYFHDKSCNWHSHFRRRRDVHRERVLVRAETISETSDLLRKLQRRQFAQTMAIWKLNYTALPKAFRPQKSEEMKAMNKIVAEMAAKVSPGVCSERGVKVKLINERRQRNNGGSVEAWNHRRFTRAIKNVRTSDLKATRRTVVRHRVWKGRWCDFHMECISGLSNMRARNFDIAELTSFKRSWSRVDHPAIATTTAMATGLVCLGLYKVIHKAPLESLEIRLRTWHCRCLRWPSFHRSSKRRDNVELVVSMGHR